MSGGSQPAPAAQPSQQTITSNPIAEWAQPTATALIGSSMQNAFNIDSNGNILGSRGFTPFGGATNAQGQFTGAPISQDQYNQQLQVAGLGVAGPSALQQQSYQGAQNLQMPGQFGAATGAAGMGTMDALTAGNRYNQSATDPYAQQAFMSPYIQNALIPQLEEMQRQYGITGTQEAGKATQQGAFGGGREALMQAENNRNKNMAMNQAIGQGYQNAFTAAQQAQQYGANLGLQGAQAGIQGAGQLAGIGGQQLAAQQGILGTQNQMGMQQQQNQQNLINQAMQNYSNQQQYPQQQAANIMNLIRSTPTTQTQTQYAAPPSALSQTAGLAGTALAGYKLAGATGGLPEDFEVKKMAGGGIASGVPPGKLQSMLADLSDQQLAQKANPQASDLDTLAAVQGEQAFRANARASMPTTPGFAPGGIVAFAEGGKSKKELYAGESEDDELLNNIMMSGLSQGMMPGYSQMPSRPQSTEGASTGNVSPASSTGKAFYNEILSSARNYAEKMGAKNPDAVAHVIATQAAAESGWGKNLSGQNNIFGIKGKGTVRSTLEDYGQGKTRVNQEFKDYASIADATKDAVNLMATNPRYAKVWNARDPIEGLNAQSTSGYATAKDYGQLLHGVYKKANMAEGGEVKHFAGKQESEVKDLYPGEKSDKAMYAGIGNVLLNAPQNILSSMNPITDIYQKGKDFIDWTKETPEQQFKKNYPELYEKKQQEKLEKEKNDRIKKAGEMSDEEYARYKAMSPNEMVQGKRPPFEENFSSNPILKPVVPEKINNQGIASVVKNQAPASEFGPSKDLMEDRVSTAPAATDRYSELMDMLKGRQAEVGKQKEQDKWMALLQGSLGTMAGTSPYALQNIGAGGMKGVSEYAASNKQRGAEQSDIYGQMLGINRAKGMEDLTRQKTLADIANQRAQLNYHYTALGATEAERKQRYDQETRRLDILEQQNIGALAERKDARTDLNRRSAVDDLRMMEDSYTKNLQKQYIDKNPMWQFDPKLKAAYEADVLKLQSLPQYLNLRKQAYPNVDFSTPQIKTDNVMRFDNKGNPVK